MNSTLRTSNGAIDPPARESELCAERRWAEAGRLLDEIMRRVPVWLQLTRDKGLQQPGSVEYSGIHNTMYADETSASADEHEMSEERRWEEAGQAVQEAVRRLHEWCLLPPDVEQHFQQARLEQLRGIRAMVDHGIAAVERRARREKSTKIHIE